MAASIIDGKGIALRVREGLAPRVEALKSRGITPGLAGRYRSDRPYQIQE